MVGTESVTSAPAQRIDLRWPCHQYQNTHHNLHTTRGRRAQTQAQGNDRRKMRSLAMRHGADGADGSAWRLLPCPSPLAADRLVEIRQIASWAIGERVGADGAGVVER